MGTATSTAPSAGSPTWGWSEWRLSENVPSKKRYAIVWLDCLFVKVTRKDSGIQKEAVHVVLAIDPEGRREVLGFYLFPFPSESSAV